VGKPTTKSRQTNAKEDATSLTKDETRDESCHEKSVKTHRLSILAYEKKLHGRNFQIGLTGEIYYFLYLLLLSISKS
jgi:hypothetical protein